MKRTTGGLVILAMAMVFGGTELAAQRGPDAPRRIGMGAQGGDVERVMRSRDQLELSDDQIQALDAIRREAVQRRNADRAEMEELMSQRRAGEADREAVREALEDRAQARQEAAEQQRERIDAILNDAQRQTLQEMSARERAFGRGYAMGMRQGRGEGLQRRGGFGPERGPASLRRRGQGFSPGFGPGFGPAGRFGRPGF